MAEELRFFLRIALFAGPAAVVYWFVSYEIAGTILLGALTLAVLLFLATTAVLVREARDDIVPDGSGAVLKAAGVTQRLVGFEEDSKPAAGSPLESEEEPVAHTSAWPVLTASSLALIGLGLLFGPWFWGPGLAIAVLVVWGWSTQLRT